MIETQTASFFTVIFVILVILVLRKITKGVAQKKSNEQKQHSYDDSYTSTNYGHPTESNYIDALLGLFSSIMKADGVVLKSELYVVKQFLRSNLSQAATLDALAKLKTLLETPYDIEEKTIAWAQTIRRCTNSETRMNILYTLIEIAMVDGAISDSEQEVIINIGNIFGIDTFSIQLLEGIIAQIYHRSTNSQYDNKQFTQAQNSSALEKAYETLGLTADVDDETVKRTYRKLAATNHPDRFANESVEKQQAATEKFQAINEAYEYIRQARGIK
ncbi:MAG: DnaJ domain-containing protein [Bacteroidales bacterium]|nr:DnaJ domain-containing protein [Bacteroidales bacterium]